MARPNIAVGRGVKFYETGFFHFGRQDATALRVDNATGIIDLRTVKTNRRINNVPYREDIAPDNDIDNYWTELPVGYVPGSEGN